MQIRRLQQYKLKQGSIRRVKERRHGQAQEASVLPSVGQSPVMQPEQVKKKLQLDRAEAAGRWNCCLVAGLCGFCRLAWMYRIAGLRSGVPGNGLAGYPSRA